LYDSHIWDIEKLSPYLNTIETEYLKISPVLGCIVSHLSRIVKMKNNHSKILV
jgi:hypothetical protein